MQLKNNKFKLMLCQCKKCKHEWSTPIERWVLKNGEKINEGSPWQCPKCKTAKWNEEK